MDDKRSEKQKIAGANANQKQLDAATKAHNRQKDINEKNAISENEKAVRETKKTERELNNKLRNISQNINTNQIQGTRARQVISNFKNRKSIDSSFNSKISKLLNKKQIAVQKETTARMNIMNIKAKKKGKNSMNAMRTLLRHMLRIKQRQTEEWIPEDSHLNLYYHDEKYYTHEEFIEIQNDVYDSIINEKVKDVNNRGDKSNKKDVKKYSDLRSSYKRKVLTIANDDKELTELIKKLETGDGRELNSENEAVKTDIELMRKNLREIVTNSEIPTGRKAQKYKVIDSFIKHRDTHLKKKNYQRVCHSERENVVSEVSFKIPHANGNLGINQREYLDSVKSFFEKAPFLKNHKVLAGCTHWDESKRIGLSENEITGSNVHLVVDCKSSENNRYQWRKSMIDFARSQQEKLNSEFNMDFNIKAKGYDLTEKEICHVGQLLQLSFYKHIQLDLFLKKNIQLKFVAEEDRNNSTYILACLEQELAIQDRLSSRYNMQYEQNIKEQQKLNEIKQEMAQEKAKLKTAEEKLKDTEKNLEEANKEIERLAQQLTDYQEKKEQLDKSIDNKTEKKKELSSEILKKIRKKDDLDRNIEKLTQEAIEKLDKLVVAVDTQNNKQNATNEAITALDKLEAVSPEVKQELVKKSSVNFEGEQEILDTLNKSKTKKSNSKQPKTSKIKR